MAEWLKAAVLKTAERKLRGFESYSLRQGLCQRRTEDSNPPCGGQAVADRERVARKSATLRSAAGGDEAGE